MQCEGLGTRLAYLLFAAKGVVVHLVHVHVHTLYMYTAQCVLYISPHI